MRKRIWIRRILRIIAFCSITIIILGIVFNQLVFKLLIGVGSIDLNYGNNERGNSIMEFALSNIKNPRGNVYHAISVQNTKNGNYDIAISALEKAYKMNPNEVGAYYGWVLLYYYHEYKKALIILNKYDDLTPNFSDYPVGECIHYLKGLAYKELGDLDQALIEFDLSVKYALDEHNESWIDYQIFLNRGITLLHLNKNEKAIEEFERVIENYKECSEAYYFKGLALANLNEKEKTCKSLNKSLELIKLGYKSSDSYVELFHEIYEQDIIEAISKNCN
jgi:tetratricopeptide (TPR) repeat protein|tara:strand:+ start:2129 stop:2962 length:834 start_codon:yes stop_codon:yes gene_type:complete